MARSQAEMDLAKLEIEHAGGTAMRLRADVRDRRRWRRRWIVCGATTAAEYADRGGRMQGPSGPG